MLSYTILPSSTCFLLSLIQLIVIIVVFRPTRVSFLQLTMKDFSVLLSVCKPDHESIQEVQVASKQLMSDYHQLRNQFVNHFRSRYKASFAHVTLQVSPLHFSYAEPCFPHHRNVFICRRHRCLFVVFAGSLARRDSYKGHRGV